MCDSALVRLRVPDQGFYDDIGFAGIFYGATGDNPPGTATEDNFGHGIGRTGGSIPAIVMERRIEGTQIKLVDGAVQGVFKLKNEG
jgi:hypothetical protein